MIFSCKPFEQLTASEIYAILALRAEVFIVEQNCPYLDPDSKDEQALHCCIYHDNTLLAYARIFDMGTIYRDALAIGRVVSSPKHRDKGLGKALMQWAIKECHSRFGMHPIRISAQCYLDKFYTHLGFRTTGPIYLEDGIPHQPMVLQ